MKLIQLAKILAVGAAFTTSAQAETIAYTFSGQLIDPFGSYDIGTPFSGTFSYVRPQTDLRYVPPELLPPGFSLPPFNNGMYNYKNFNFQIGNVQTGYNATSDSYGLISVNGGSFWLDSNKKSYGNVGGLTLTSFFLDLMKSLENISNNYSLPGQGMKGSDFVSGRFELGGTYIPSPSILDSPMTVANGLLSFLGPVNMPLGVDSSIYRFAIDNVGPNALTFIDPLVAVGYDYAIGSGDPNFASVLLPNIGDGQFTIEYLNGEELVQLALTADTPFYFPDGGVSDFKVRGIETTAALDPDDTNAFITGLSFASAGNFTGTMTPVTVETAPVPLPSGLILFVSGILGMLPSRLPRGKNKQQFQTVTS